jgi:flagella basal body P-ring formation protein FlgA
VRLVLAFLLLLAVVLAASPTGAQATGTTLGADALVAMARQWLAERLGSEVEPTALEPLGAPPALALPAGSLTLQLTQQSGSAMSGTITVLVEARVTDARGVRTARSATVNFRVNALQDVVVAVRELPRKTQLTAADVRRERRPVSRVPVGAIRETGEIVGKETNRPVAPGEVLTGSSVSAPLLIRRGALVALVLEGPSFRIVARGVAAEDGVLGAPIRVINQSSRREVVGRVEDDRTVRVQY